MKIRGKGIVLISLIIILIGSFTYYQNFIRGSYTSTSALFVDSVEVSGSIVTITGGTSCSGTGLAGYDTVWVADELWIKLRYSIVSKFNPNGRFEISYDKGERPLYKVFLVGPTDDDKKQAWPATQNEETITDLR